MLSPPKRSRAQLDSHGHGDREQHIRRSQHPTDSKTTTRNQRNQVTPLPMSRPPTSKSTLSLCLFPRPSTQILTFPVLGRALALFLVRRSRSRASWSVERDRAEAPSLLSGDQSMMSGISLHQDQHELVKSVSWHVEELQVQCCPSCIAAPDAGLHCRIRC